MNEAPSLVFEFSPNGKAAGMTITAKIGDDVIHCDKGDVAKNSFRESYIDAICKRRPAIDRNEVDRLLTQEAAAMAARQAKPLEPEPPADSHELLMKMPEHVRDEARHALESTNVIATCYTDITKLGVAGEGQLVPTLILVAVSRLLDKPLSAIVQAPSSTGKSYTIEKVASTVPPEAVLHATSLTENALYYLPSGTLSHRFVVAGERSRRQDDDTATTTRALRELQSAGRITKVVPQKGPDGRIVTEIVEQVGPIAYCESTTLSHIFDEDLNRALLLHADERESQTRNILGKLAQGYSGAVRPNADAIIQKHFAMHRTLQRRSIVVPFAEQVAERFPADRVEARRAFPHLMGMVQASASLHQFQREIDADGQIIATVDDYEIARMLAIGPLSRQLKGKMNDSTIRYHERLVKWAAGLDSFSTTEAYKQDRASDRAVRGWLTELAEVGAVEQITESKGSKPATWRVVETDTDLLAAGDCGLPTADELRS